MWSDKSEGKGDELGGRKRMMLKWQREGRHLPSNTVSFFQELRSDVGSGVSRDTSNL